MTVYYKASNINIVNICLYQGCSTCTRVSHAALAVLKKSTTALNVAHLCCNSAWNSAVCLTGAFLCAVVRAKALRLIHTYRAVPLPCPCRPLTMPLCQRLLKATEQHGRSTAWHVWISVKRHGRGMAWYVWIRFYAFQPMLSDFYIFNINISSSTALCGTWLPEETSFRLSYPWKLFTNSLLQVSLYPPTLHRSIYFAFVFLRVQEYFFIFKNHSY